MQIPHKWTSALEGRQGRDSVFALGDAVLFSFGMLNERLIGEFFEW